MHFSKYWKFVILYQFTRAATYLSPVQFQNLPFLSLNGPEGGLKFTNFLQKIKIVKIGIFSPIKFQVSTWIRLIRECLYVATVQPGGSFSRICKKRWRIYPVSIDLYLFHIFVLNIFSRRTYVNRKFFTFSYTCTAETAAYIWELFSSLFSMNTHM